MSSGSSAAQRLSKQLAVGVMLGIEPEHLVGQSSQRLLDALHGLADLRLVGLGHPGDQFAVGESERRRGGA